MLVVYHQIIPNSLWAWAKLFFSFLQADPRREGVDRTEGRGNREPRGQREPGGAEPGAGAPSRSFHHCLGHRILPRLLLTSQRTLHPQTHPAQPGPRHGAHGGHDTGIQAQPYLCPIMRIYSTFSLTFLDISSADRRWKNIEIKLWLCLVCFPHVGNNKKRIWPL